MTAAGVKVARGTVSKKARLRLLLFSDLLLDRPYEWAQPTLAEARRAANREALVEIVRAARDHSVDVIACAGNLFDRRTVRPATVQWLMAVLRSANKPVLIAPGSRDFVGPIGSYTRHEWPDNVTIFDSDRFTPLEIADGVTIWGAGHTEPHRTRSFLDQFEVDRDGINLALFHAAERSGLEREPELDPCATFDEPAISTAGFDHALVGHYQQSHFGWIHTYPGAPLAHGFDNGPAGGAVLVTLMDDGTIERDHLDLASLELHKVDVDLTGTKSTREVARRITASVGGGNGVIRLRLTGCLSPDVVLQREEILDVVRSTDDDLVLEWGAGVDLDIDQVTEEQTIRGQFVRDVLATDRLPEQRRQRVLLIGLRALAGSDVLEGPR